MLVCTIAACTGKYERVKEGEKLAKNYCASCHLFPDPSLLEKKTWAEGVLPQMAKLMYVDAYYNPYDNSGPDGDKDVKRTAPENLFPYKKWELINEYYLAVAPEKISEPKDSLAPIEIGLKNFAIHTIAQKFKSPMTTFVKIDTNEHRMLFADGAGLKLYTVNNQFSVVDSVNTEMGTVAENKTNDGVQLLSMGILRPSDAKLGKLILASKAGRQTILDSLQRPVFFKDADLNQDGKKDILMSEFGFRQGSLSWFENMGIKNIFHKHILRPLPGAMFSEVYDFNQDGKPDIIALMAQADEGVFIYYNEGNGKFREERVAGFPPVYGSSYFQLFDFNNDGKMDFLTANGDNADYSVALKAYHGIRIFINDGQNHFTQKVFLPVNGIQKAIPADFDNDGDIDIASIAFFPDYNNKPKESFIYWENTGNNHYKRYSFDQENDGRWMTMDAGDVDGDGDKDIILGSASLTFGNIPQSFKDNWTKKNLSVLILENTVITKNK